MDTNLIIVAEYCQICHIEPSFIFKLEKGGLIEIDTIEGVSYLSVTQLQDVERYTRLYYDLAINVEGIDAIHHLLERIQSMQKEIGHLRNKLKLYETNDRDTLDSIENL